MPLLKIDTSEEKSRPRRTIAETVCEMKATLTLLVPLTMISAALSLISPALCQDQRDIRKEIADAVAQATNQSEDQVLREYKESITVVGSVTDEQGIWLTFELGNRLYVGSVRDFV